MLVMFQDLIMQGGDDDVVGHSLCRTVSCIGQAPRLRSSIANLQLFGLVRINRRGRSRIKPLCFAI